MKFSETFYYFRNSMFGKLKSDSSARVNAK
jgi:hypothetical protein